MGGGTKMNKIRDRIIKYYDEQYLNNSQGKELPVLWPSKTVQLLRFKIITEIDDLNGKTILDVGCGYGDLYYFLKKNGVKLKDYVGIDLHPEIIHRAKEAHPELKLFHVDISENNYKSAEFDYVLASGVFYHELDNWAERVRLSFDEMYRISKIGVSANFLRYRKTKRNPVSHYVKVGSIANLAEIYTKRYTIRCDYKDNDITLYLYKTGEGSYE